MSRHDTSLDHGEAATRPLARSNGLTRVGLAIGTIGAIVGA
ncbi:hypothetical protein ACERIT_07665 [Halopenitus sp. H-Gu1]